MDKAREIGGEKIGAVTLISKQDVLIIAQQRGINLTPNNMVQTDQAK
jgi:hypothetical protein